MVFDVKAIGRPLVGYRYWMCGAIDADTRQELFG